jgi:hypothetical protein
MEFNLGDGSHELSLETTSYKNIEKNCLHKTQNGSMYTGLLFFFSICLSKLKLVLTIFEVISMSCGAVSMY